MLRGLAQGRLVKKRKHEDMLLHMSSVGRLWAIENTSCRSVQALVGVADRIRYDFTAKHLGDLLAGSVSCDG